MRASKFIDRSIPILFVLIWSTGWIVARYSAEYADPLTFLLLRYLLAGSVLIVVALAFRAPWPKERGQWGHAMVTGVLIHAIYLGSVWWAIRHGVPASVSALIAALQPILTTILAPRLMRERVRLSRWIGVGLGLCGLVLVLLPGLLHVDPHQLNQMLGLIGINAFGMLSVTLGSFYQKRFVHSGDLRTITVIQYAAAAAVTLPAAYMLEPMHVQWNGIMVATMAWSVLALSIGAIGLYLLLIRRGEVSKSAQLIFMVPPTAAVQAYFLFGEHLDGLQLAGMALTAAGVALASRN
ncbi:MAG: DMT family transporter [Hyphomicrobiales bacterium]|nr:DMT family transporter [Hyphomicrobiales bacterium]